MLPARRTPHTPVPNISAVADLSTETHRRMVETTLFTRTKACVGRLVKEAIEISLHTNSFSRGNRCVLSRDWYLLTNVLWKAMWGPQGTLNDTRTTKGCIGPNLPSSAYRKDEVKKLTCSDDRTHPQHQMGHSDSTSQIQQQIAEWI
jgi:hypothetical protein